MTSDVQPVVVQSVAAGESAPQLEQVNTAPAPETQSLTIIEESATVEAVEKVLPAVVTVLNRGRLGGGSGSGFFISSDGYLVSNFHVVEG
ncbi:MAG: 2-alkenal reductase, partial [Chloroflexi bacterium]|nr:2-alkenal reductase [Chloroflexota bacterium]